MERHLNDADITELLLGTASLATREHVAVCGACRTECESTAAAAASLKRDVSERAAMAEHFWTRQRAHIAARTSAARGSLRWALAGGLALVAVAGALIFGQPRDSAPSASLPATAQDQAIDPDEQLLLEIQHSLRHESPEALAPAALLVQEIDSANGDPNQVKEN